MRYGCPPPFFPLFGWVSLQATLIDIGFWFFCTAACNWKEAVCSLRAAVPTCLTRVNSPMHPHPATHLQSTPNSATAPTPSLTSLWLQEARVGAAGAGCGARAAGVPVHARAPPAGAGHTAGPQAGRGAAAAAAQAHRCGRSGAGAVGALPVRCIARAPSPHSALCYKPL